MKPSSSRPPNSELRCCSSSGKMKRDDSSLIRRLAWPDILCVEFVPRDPYTMV